MITITVAINNKIVRTITARQFGKLENDVRAYYAELKNNEINALREFMVTHARDERIMKLVQKLIRKAMQYKEII